MASWLIRALTLGLLAIILPLAARGLYGPPGAVVNIRWQPSVDAAERQRLETEWQLVNGQESSPSTWRYDLTTPSQDRLRAIVAHAAVADTHNIDRQRYSLAPEASRTARRAGLVTAGSAVVVGLVDRLALLLGMLAGLYVLVRSSPGPLARAVPATVAVLPLTPRARMSGAIALALAPGVCLIAFPSVVTRMLGPRTDFEAHIEFAQGNRGNRRLAAAFRLPRRGDRGAGAHIGRLDGRGGHRDAGGRGRVRRRSGVVAAGGAAHLGLGAVGRRRARAGPALCVLQPVLPLDSTRYDEWLFGYFPPNQWHSPTTLFAKPFALLLLGLGPAVVWPAHGARAGRKRMLTAATLVVMSGIVKPSFSMAFLPALCALAVLHWRRTDWLWLGVSFVLPAAAVLAWQYDELYTLDTARGGVILAPLQVIGFYAPTDLLTLGWRLAASVLFPLAAAACFPSVRADRRVQLGWATFLVGAAIGYLLAEGHSASHGAFLWSGQLAAFVLFAASAVAVLRADATGGADKRRVVRFTLCGGVFVWHVASGIQYLYAMWLA